MISKGTKIVTTQMVFCPTAMNGRAGMLLPYHSYPACAVRHWALDFNAVGVEEIGAPGASVPLFVLTRFP